MSRASIMKEAFELLQRDGKIPKASIPTALRAAGMNPSEEKLKEIMATAVDIDMAGYESLVTEHYDKTDTVEAVKEAFRVFDKDHNGTVSVAEFRHIMTTMGEKYTEEEFCDLIQGFDANGVIPYEKFVEKMLAPFTEHESA
ncbi:calmodulin-like protein, putative [Trypanosoma equiperdum]|uniref:Calmodulin-like protein, putative n=3 Tax=Trypanozoon TaxID=39700 RepID=Q38DQ2_TRYB2|nr:EF hand containing protein [Trypanosoma brucei gambiense DAL972]XP_827398.1 calmodulin-like protein, putative [Trypanosoma brucei brucei TREU927]EAN77068.1 calmodulin-like protein, putative [Trypanosoma brucei brucei TREU927]CBH14594.1 EF hand containing protein [Trypanosoma brucei gambiense DAL972]SCU68924.1 calmodulin-like protein, putative [Trypanosoma equiperdum]|eukprot:XP_011776860.1 EF hand containing protein [Trypanosoma brucei gambiense DAL972]